MHRTKEYVERPWEEIKSEVDLAVNAYPEAQRIFLADGDALNVATDKLIQILVFFIFQIQKFEKNIVLRNAKKYIAKERR